MIHFLAHNWYYFILVYLILGIIFFLVSYYGGIKNNYQQGWFVKKNDNIRLICHVSVLISLLWPLLLYGLIKDREDYFRFFRGPRDENGKVPKNGSNRRNVSFPIDPYAKDICNNVDLKVLYGEYKKNTSKNSNSKEDIFRDAFKMGVVVGKMNNSDVQEGA